MAQDDAKILQKVVHETGDFEKLSSISTSHGGAVAQSNL